MEDFHQVRRKLRFQGMEVSVSVGILFPFRFGSVTFFAENLEVVNLVASTFTERYDVVYLTMLGGEGISTDFALVSCFSMSSAMSSMEAE